MNELTLPCSDCGTALVEQPVHTRDLSVSTALDGTVSLARCPSCEARFYPRQALAQLSGSTTDREPRGDR